MGVTVWATLLVFDEFLDDTLVYAYGGWLVRWWRRDVPTIILASPYLRIRITLSSMVSRWSGVRCDA